MYNVIRKVDTTDKTVKEKKEVNDNTVCERIYY